MAGILLSLVMISAIAQAQSISQVLLIPREGQSANLELMLAKEVGVDRSITSLIAYLESLENK